jgi:hypothetical protein
VIRPPRSPHPRRGLSLVEVLIALGLMGLVLGNVYMVIGKGTKSYGVQTGDSVADAHARRTLDRVALAVVGASRSSIYDAMEAPFSGSEINYQTCLGVEDGVVVWSAPQRIALTNDTGRQVTWFEQPGLANERRVAWSNWVTQLFEGEVANGLDDNRNGLKDEKGLSFDLDGDSVIIRLTIEKPGVDGEPIVKTLQTRVTCRN